MQKTGSTNRLTKDEIIETGIIRNLLYGYARNVVFYTQYQNVLNLRYLTDRTIEKTFLEVTTEDDFRVYNQVLGNNLAYELPIFQGVSLSTLLEVRQKEHDAFITYRDSIDEIVKKYVSQRVSLSLNDIKEIYADLIRPQLHSLDIKAKTIRNSLLKKAAKNAVITTGVLTFGLCSSILPTGMEPILYALGFYKAVEVIDSIVDAKQTPGEIRNNNLYFLWKLSKKI